MTYEHGVGNRMANQFGDELQHLAMVSSLVGAGIFLIATLVSPACCAQASAVNPTHFHYEVVSIRQNKTDSSHVTSQITDYGYTEKNVTLMALIREAYGFASYPVVDDHRVSGVPASLGNEKYDLEARMDDSVVDELKKLSADDRRAARLRMLQAILADRFNLAIHREEKEGPVYILGVGKDGSKMNKAKPGDLYATAPEAKQVAVSGKLFNAVGAGMMDGYGVPMTKLAAALSFILGRPVLDRTGLTDVYDFKLQWNPDEGVAKLVQDEWKAAAAQEASQSSDGPSLFAALQQQLGLKLQSGRGNIEVIVVDRVERPTKN